MTPRQAVTLLAPEVAPVGGMERALHELANGLLARGMPLTVVARLCAAAPHPSLRWIRMRGPRRPAAISGPFMAVAGRHLVRRHAAGLVHTQGALIVRSVDVVTVQFVHHAFAQRRDLPRRQRDTVAHRVNERADEAVNLALERWCFGGLRVRRVVAVSHGIARELRSHFPALEDRIRVIPNGVDTQRFAPDSGARARVRRELGLGDERVAMFVGGDWQRKGLPFALEGLPGADGWRLVVVGQGDVERYRAMAAELGVADRVHFVGRQTAPERWLASADAFVSPTAYEAFPLAVLEAASAGLPLLVTRVNGTEEVLRQGENGLEITRDGDSVRAALGALASAEDRARLGAEARRSASRYSWAEIVDAHVRLYGELATSAR